MNLRELLEAQSQGSDRKPYRNLRHFVVVNGRVFRPAPLPKEIRRGNMTVCYGNSHRLAKRKRLIYVEGFAIRDTGGTPFQHAWCSDETGVVFDSTWGEGFQYFGVPLDFGYVRKNTSPENMSVLDQWQRNWPILTDAPDLWQYKGTIQEMK